MYHVCTTSGRRKFNNPRCYNLFTSFYKDLHHFTNSLYHLGKILKVMNSDFEYKKTCQYCGKTFIAQKATTKYCSIQCSRHAFKEQCRNKRLEDEDVNDFLDRIETVDTHRFFLTIDEVRRLHDTPCKDDVVKRASIFSILTGLRMSDILALTWEKFEIYPDGGHCVRLTTEKTDASAYNPVSKEAYEICGTPFTASSLSMIPPTSVSGTPTQKTGSTTRTSCR